MNFIKDDTVYICETVLFIIQLISEYFSCHDENISFWIKFDISGQNTDFAFRKCFFEIKELLIRECFDGTRVDNFLTKMDR